MHPIERLRFVARAGWGGPAELGTEAAYALAELAEREPAAVLPACRRLLERNPSCGPLWWVSARVLCAGDPLAEASRCAGALEDDCSNDELELALGDRRAVRHGGIAEAASADVVVVEAYALGHGGMVVDGDDLGLLEAARVTEVEVWVLGGAGRVLPPRLWDALADRTAQPPPRSRTAASDWFDLPASSATVVGLGGVTAVAGPDGVSALADALGACDCPEPAELVARW